VRLGYAVDAKLGVQETPRVQRFRQELTNETYHSSVRSYFIEDFGYLVAAVHHGGPWCALAAHQERGTLTPERQNTIMLINHWLYRDGGHHLLDKLLIDFAKRGTGAQRRALLRGLYESVDALVLFQRIAKPNAEDAVHVVTREYSSTKRRRFGRVIWTARQERRRRTGAPVPSWRARGPAFSVQAFRKTELFKALGPLFTPTLPVKFQAGEQDSSEKRESLERVAAVAKTWLAPKLPRETLKQNPAPTTAFIIPLPLERKLEVLLPPSKSSISNLVVVRAVLTVLGAKIWFEELPADIGLGSGVAGLRRLRKWQKLHVWSKVEALLRAHPATKDLDFDRLLRRRMPFKRRRRLVSG
jgi:hypothetical protein